MRDCLTLCVRERVQIAADHTVNYGMQTTSFKLQARSRPCSRPSTVQCRAAAGAEYHRQCRWQSSVQHHRSARCHLLHAPTLTGPNQPRSMHEHMRTALTAAVTAAALSLSVTTAADAAVRLPPIDKGTQPTRTALHTDVHRPKSLRACLCGQHHRPGQRGQ